MGIFEKLEDEMCSYVPGGPSPNRMDAMVWAFSELMLHRYHGPVIELWNG